jgi:tetratricopeptide (TPR) repeat protein
MESVQLKTEMLNLFQFFRSEMDAFINSLTPQQKAERGSLQKWSAKDTLAHLVFWGDHFNHQVEKALAGETVPLVGDYYDQVNDGVLYEHLDQPFDEARAQEKAAFVKAMQLLESISADDLNDPKKFAFLDGPSLLERALGAKGWHVAHHISDYYLKSDQMEKAQNLEESLTEKLRAFPTWKGTAEYNLACFYALNGMKEKALGCLKIAFKERPSLIEWSEKDSDMDPLREDAEFKALVGK